MASASEDGLKSSGTGFAVSHQGHILTNYHVVEDCPSIRITANGTQKELAVVATDKRNDLAIVKFPGPLSNVARFREGRNIRPGDSIVVVGYPLHGLLASEANVTTGTVSALAGLENDTRLLQITAPVQRGNSGGPLLDNSGNIVGVIVGKLNAMTIAKVTGDIPQNINFAINGVVAKAFLDSHSVRYETAASTSKLESAEVGATAKQFTVLLECYPQKVSADQRALDSERQALDSERRAVEAERRAMEEEREALAETRRATQAAQERALQLEDEARMKQARLNEEAELVAAEKQRLQSQKEAAEKDALLEAQAASERVIRFHEQERAEEQEQDQIKKSLPPVWLDTKSLEMRKKSIVGKDGAPMMLVPEGAFIYGGGKFVVFMPAKELVLPAFYMDRYEVTVRLYAMFIKATGRTEPQEWPQQVAMIESGDRPVVQVTWNDADDYCRYYGKRLPTESEWEKAARGTDGRLHPWGNKPHPFFITTNLTNNLGGYCWFCNVYKNTLKPVGSYETDKSPYQIYDMAGNAWEWTSGEASNGNKIARGESWRTLWLLFGEIPYRTHVPPNSPNHYLGFRCAQDAP